MQIVIQHARGGRIASPLRESYDLEDAHAAIEPDRQHVAGLDGMARRHFARAIDADMARLDQRGRAGAGLHHPRVPQPFIETLALQTTPIRAMDRYFALSFDAFCLREPVPRTASGAGFRLKRFSGPCGWR